MRIIYKGIKPQPAQMPGRYLNEDVLTESNAAGTVFQELPVAGSNEIRVYDTGWIPGNIYTWNNNSLQRGPGGSPTQLCQGQPVQ